ncbi:MAG: hypothetical protein WDZ69_00470 [Candidatus Pacearchaeota archaeon]
MNERNDKITRNILNVIGVFYVVLAILIFLNAYINYEEISIALWLSYIILFLVGVGLLIKSSYLVVSQFTIIFIPYLVWSADFFYILFTGNSLFGIADYVFTQRTLLEQVFSLQHIFLIPVSIFAIYSIKLKRADFWIFSSVQVVLFFFLSRIFTNPENNINCVFESCLPFQPEFLPYPLIWFLSYGIMIALTSLALSRMKIFWKK